MPANQHHQIQIITNQIPIAQGTQQNDL